MKKKILVIDDEPEFLKPLKMRLEANQFECITAEDPIAGLLEAVRQHPHLVLLDLMLPKMSGFGFLRIFCRNPNLMTIPVIVLTALKDEEIAREAIDLGAAAFLTKSCSPRELLATVENYIQFGGPPTDF